MKLSLVVALVPMFAVAGIKYWDNPEYKAFDVGDYVQGDLIWNYDGIRNVGATLDHDPDALTWANLGSFGSANDLVLQKYPSSSWTAVSAAELEAGTYGEWTDKGFVFKGNSRFRRDSPGQISVTNNYTIQFLVDATSVGQAKSLGFLFSVQYDQFAMLVSKTDGKLYWRNIMAYNAANNGHSLDSFLGGGTFDYGTAIVDGKAKTTAFFSGTKVPTSGDGFRQYAEVYGRTEKGYVIGCTSGAGNEFAGTMKFLRVYDHALSEEEVAWNRVVDEARYFNRVAPLPVTNVVVATAVSGANGTEPVGNYAVDGRHVFTAPATVTVGGIEYVCTGYTVETRDGNKWSEPVFHKAAIFQPCACAVTECECVRLTWQWARSAGLANLGYDVSDYVWNGLAVFYDGICNVGTNQPHSYSATNWVNLGSVGVINDVFVQRLKLDGSAWVDVHDLSTVGVKDPGYWTENGFTMNGTSRFRCNAPGGFSTGKNYSLQMLIDAKASDQVTAQCYLLGANNNTFAFHLRKSDGVLFWKTLGPLSPESLYPYMVGGTYDYMTAIMKDDDTQTFFRGSTIPTSDDARGYKTNTSASFSETGYCLGGYGKTGVADLFVGTMKNFRYYNRALTQAEVMQNRKVDNWRYFGIPDVTNVIVQSTVSYLRGDEPDGLYAIDGSHTFTAPATITAKGIDYACAGYTVETWDGFAWSNAVSDDSNSYAYNTTAGLVRLTWRWRPTHGLRTAADYSYADYSQAGLYWHYDGLLNQGVGKARSTAANATWVNLGSSGAKYDLSKYRANNSTPDGEWTADGYFFRGGTRYRASGVPIGPFKSFTLQTLVDADMTNQPVGKACYIMSGIWDYLAMALGNKNDTYNGVLYGNFQGLGTNTGNKHAAVYFKNDSGHYDYATSIMDYDAKTAQVFGGVEPPTSGTGFHQFSSVISRSDSGFGLGNSGGDGTEALVGTFKSFRYYDRVLTEEELVRNRNVDAVRYFGDLGVTNVLVTTKFAAGGEQAESGAYKVEGSWDFTATTVRDRSGAVVPVAGYYTETLVDGEWSKRKWHSGTTYFYEEGTSPTCVRLTWGPLPDGMMLLVR